MPVDMKLRQHEVQAVSGPGACLAVAWTDDSKTEGMHGWNCGYTVSLNGGQSWNAPLFHKHGAFVVSGNPAIAVDAQGVVFAVSMSAEDDYSRGILELSTSTNGGQSWSAWTKITCKASGIPDRPKLLAAQNGNLHLVFSNVERYQRRVKVLRSTIQITSSMNRGETWSEPKTISVGLQRSRWFLDGYQGAAITETPNGELLVSWADYYGNSVWFSVGCSAGSFFDLPVRMKLKAFAGINFSSWLLGATFGAPVTELAVDLSGLHLIISVHEAHAMGRVLLVGSQDGGKTWTRLAQLARLGTNASIKFDSSGRLHAMWTELRDQQVDVRYATSMDFGRTFRDAVSLAGGGARVVSPKSPEERDECAAALGSYQSFVIGKDGRASAFWIDLRDGLFSPRLYHSTWQA